MIAAAKKDQRILLRLALDVRDPADDDRVVAPVVLRVEAAFENGQRAFQHRTSRDSVAIPDIVPLARSRPGETGAEVALIVAQEMDAERFCRQQRVQSPQAAG